MKNCISLLLLANIAFCLHASENLKFVLDHKHRIKSYNNHNMGFYISPEEFTNKKIYEAIPLSHNDKMNTINALKEAATSNKNTSAAYTLDGKNFLAFIEPLKTIRKGKEESSFIIEVHEDMIR